jgi:hypothetical protein
VLVADNPLTSVVLSTGAIIDDRPFLRKVSLNETTDHIPVE